MRIVENPNQVCSLQDAGGIIRGFSLIRRASSMQCLAASLPCLSFRVFIVNPHLSILSSVQVVFAFAGCWKNIFGWVSYISCSNPAVIRTGLRKSLLVSVLLMMKSSMAMQVVSALVLALRITSASIPHIFCSMKA